MSKMSEQFEKNLGNAKYDLYEVCKALAGELDEDKAFVSYGVEVDLMKALAKAEGK